MTKFDTTVAVPEGADAPETVEYLAQSLLASMRRLGEAGYSIIPDSIRVQGLRAGELTVTFDGDPDPHHWPEFSMKGI